MLEYGEELEDGELALVVVDAQVLPLALDGGEGTHGHTGDGVGGEQLPQHHSLTVTEVKTHVLKGSFLGA